MAERERQVRLRQRDAAPVVEPAEEVERAVPSTAARAKADPRVRTDVDAPVTEPRALCRSGAEEAATARAEARTRRIEPTVVVRARSRSVSSATTPIEATTPTTNARTSTPSPTASRNPQRTNDT